MRHQRLNADDPRVGCEQCVRRIPKFELERTPEGVAVSGYTGGVQVRDTGDLPLGKP